MSDEKFEELIELSILYGLLDKAQEMIQRNNLIGGHKGYHDDMLNDMIRDVREEMKKLKEDD